jgi:hypothetical protein
MSKEKRFLEVKQFIKDEYKDVSKNNIDFLEKRHSFIHGYITGIFAYNLINEKQFNELNSIKNKLYIQVKLYPDTL